MAKWIWGQGIRGAGLAVLVGAVAATAGCGGDQRGRDVPPALRDFTEDDASAVSRRRQLFGSVHDSVDPLSGELFVRHVDLLIPGNGGLDLEVARTYASKGRWYANSPYGPGWRLHFGLVGNATDACDGKHGHRPVLYLPDGQRIALVGNADSEGPRYISRERWSADCDGEGHLFARSPDGTTYDFGSVAKSADAVEPEGLEPGTETNIVEGIWQVERIVDRNDNWLEFEYRRPTEGVPVGGGSSDSPATGYPGSRNSSAGRLTQITASDGREVAFEYDTDKAGMSRLSAVVAVDEVTGDERRWTYAHELRRGAHGDCLELRQGGYGEAGGTDNDEGCGSAPDPQERQRLVVTDPDGEVWSFGHCGDPTECGFSMINPRGGRTVYRFEQQTGYGPVVYDKRTFEGDDELGQWSFSYHPDRPEGAVSWVWGPASTTLYIHYGAQTTNDGTAWLIGALKDKYVFGPTQLGSLPSLNTAIEEVHFDWDKQLVSLEDLSARAPHGEPRKDGRTHAAIMVRRRVVRDGTEYVTEYGKHDAYGNPGAKREIGPAGERNTEMTWLTNRQRWIVATLDDQSTEGVGTIWRDFDERGNLVHENSYGTVTTFTHHGTGDVSTRTDANGRVTAYSEYVRGLPQRTVLADGRQEQRLVNGTGTVAVEQDAAGAQTTIAYDGKNRPTSITWPQYSAAEIEYPSAGVETLRRGEYSERLERDPFGRLVLRERSDGQETIVERFEYDAVGRRTFASAPYSATDEDGASRGTSTEYDALGRVVAVGHADGSERRYTYLPGNRVEILDEAGYTTVRHFASYGDPDQRYLIGIESPEDIVTVVGRNPVGQVTSVVQEIEGENLGLVRYFEYDEQHRLARRFDPEVGWTRWSYDGVGNVLSEGVEGTVATQHEYDELGRRVRTTLPDGETVSSDYDAVGNLIRIANPTAVRSYEYDAIGNLEREAIAIDGHELVVDYERDELGRPSSIRYPSGRTVSLAPDAFGRPTAVAPFVDSITYHPSGRPAELGYASGVLTSVEEDVRGRIVAIRTSGVAGTYVDLHYEDYDGLGNVGWIHDPTAPQRDVELEYDGVSRLVGANGYWGPGSYEYDGRGNLVRRDQGGDASQWDIDEHLRVVGLGYDERGNIVSAPGLELEFDGANRLRVATTPEGTVRFDYDGANLLVRQRNDDVTTYYVHAASGEWIGQYDDNGQPIRELVSLAGKTIGAMSPSGDAAVVTDALGSVVAGFDAAGSLLATEQYAPYGERQGLVDTNADPRGGAWYTGRLEDPTTGLTYHQNRWYSAELGRFLSVDPVHFVEHNIHSFNRYAYANNNPMRFVDPDGRMGVDEGAGYQSGWADGGGASGGDAGSEAGGPGEDATTESAGTAADGVADGASSSPPNPQAATETEQDTLSFATSRGVNVSKATASYAVSQTSGGRIVTSVTAPGLLSVGGSVFVDEETGAPIGTTVDGVAKVTDPIVGVGVSARVSFGVVEDNFVVGLGVTLSKGSVTTGARGWVSLGQVSTGPPIDSVFGRNGVGF